MGLDYMWRDGKCTFRLAHHHHLCQFILIFLHSFQAGVQQRLAAVALAELFQGRG